MAEQTRDGVIVLVQESRFQLEDREGRHQLFILHHGAPLEPADLEWLQRAEVPVRVVYNQASDLIAAIAHDVRPADDP